MSKSAKKPIKPRKPPAWVEATRARLKAKGGPSLPKLDDPARLDERVEGLTSLLQEALRMLPGDVGLARDLVDLAWSSLDAEPSATPDGRRFAAMPEVQRCYEYLVALRRTRFVDDRRAAFLLRAVEHAEGWEIRARMVDLG